MLVQSLRISRSALARTSTRTFVTTAARRADPVQAIYLNALKEYKPKPETAASAEGQVKKWAQPAAPKQPDSANPELVDQLSAYEAQAVEVEGQESPAAGESVAARGEDWFEEDAVFGSEEEAHH